VLDPIPAPIVSMPPLTLISVYQDAQASQKFPWWFRVQDGAGSGDCWAWLQHGREA
jgi:hypothetical protein